MKIYRLAYFLLLLVPATHLHAYKGEKPGNATGLVFTSVDGGQSWQDISKGLPITRREDDGIGKNVSVATNNGIYVAVGNEMYYNNPLAKEPSWTKDAFPGGQNSLVPANNGLFSFNYWGGNIQKKGGGPGWTPVFASFGGKQMRTVFETAAGTVFIGTDEGLFKSANNGKTWSHVLAGGMVTKMVASNGVLLAAGSKGIVRSTDEGEHWTLVISEGGVGIDVARIKGGFAAISYSTSSRTRRIRVSYDAGKTWQAIDASLQPRGVTDQNRVPAQAALSSLGFLDSARNPGQGGLPVQAFISTIIQLGDNFFCGHPDGIYKSSDKGTTWKLVLPTVKGKLFTVYVSGNVLYAVAGVMGC